MEDSWDNANTTYDLMGNQRFPDADLQEFYTLGAGGRINAYLENMEQFDSEYVARL
jgi:hypothetical protein